MPSLIILATVLSFQGSIPILGMGSLSHSFNVSLLHLRQLLINGPFVGPPFKGLPRPAILQRQNFWRCFREQPIHQLVIFVFGLGGFDRAVSERHEKYPQLMTLPE